MPDRLREQAETFLVARADLRYRRSAGQLREGEFRDLYRKFGSLLSPDSVTELQRTLAGTTGTEEKAARFFVEFLVDGMARRGAAAEIEQRALWRRTVLVSVGERSLPLGEVEGRIRETADPSERHALEEARFAALDDLDPLLLRILEAEHEAVAQLGHGDYVRSRGVLSGIDHAGLAREGVRFLADTDAVYRDLLAWHLPRLAGVPTGDATRADAARLLRAEPYDEFFLAGATLRAVRAAAGAIGLEAFGPERVRVEELATAGRPTEVHPLQVPGEVVLTVSAASGRLAAETLLRETGAALGWAYTADDLPLEFRRLGDASVTLAYSHLFGGLLANPLWLVHAHDLHGDERAAYLRLDSLLQLFSLRTNIARLQYELELNDRLGLVEKPERYAEILTDATGVRHDPRDHLWEVEPGLFAARRIRAAQLHTHLVEHLRDRLDEDWFRNPRTGGALMDLFASGRRYTAEEVARQLASGPLSFAPLVKQFAERG